MQEKVVEKLEEVATNVEEVVTEDIWGAIEKFLERGFHFGEGDHKNDSGRYHPGD